MEIPALMNSPNCYIYKMSPVRNQFFSFLFSFGLYQSPLLLFGYGGNITCLEQLEP